MVEKVMTKKSWITFISIALVLVVAQAVCAAQTVSQSVTDNVPAATATAPQASVPTPASLPSTASTMPSGSAPQLQTRDPRYRIAASDSFDLTFPLSPEYNQ